VSRAPRTKYREYLLSRPRDAHRSPSAFELEPRESQSHRWREEVSAQEVALSTVSCPYCGDRGRYRKDRGAFRSSNAHSPSSRFPERLHGARWTLRE